MRPASGVVLHPQPPPGQSLLLLPLDLGGGALDLRLQLPADKHCSRRRRSTSLYVTTQTGETHPDVVRITH